MSASLKRKQRRIKEREQKREQTVRKALVAVPEGKEPILTSEAGVLYWDNSRRFLINVESACKYLTMAHEYDNVGATKVINIATLVACAKYRCELGNTAMAYVQGQILCKGTLSAEVEEWLYSRGIFARNSRQFFPKIRVMTEEEAKEAGLDTSTFASTQDLGKTHTVAAEAPPPASVDYSVN